MTTTRVSSSPQVDVAIRASAAGVCRRAELTDQPQLLEPRLELRAENGPLDPVERGEGSLDRWALPVGAEVGAKPGPKVPGPTHVERLTVSVAEDIDARALGGSEREPALGMHPACSGRRQLEDVRDGPRSALLREPQKVDEDLGRRPSVGQRPVARLRRGAEEMCQG